MGLFTLVEMHAAPLVSLLCVSVLISLSSADWEQLSSNGVDVAPSYSSPSVYPGSRNGHALYQVSNSLIMFGGRDAQNWYRGDMWSFDLSSNTWEYMGGTTSSNAAGVYGTVGVPSSSYRPGNRYLGGFVSENSSLYLFGGSGYGTSTERGYLNDLWRFDLGSLQWTWVSGSSSVKSAGSYGTKNVPATSNTPGARSQSSMNTHNGDIIVFGGLGYGSDSTQTGGLSDLWRYSPSSNEWTWISGSSAVDSSDDETSSVSYGTFGQPSATNTPGGRYQSASWTDSEAFYLFGGFNVQGSPMNDLWKFNFSLNQWAWIGGSDAVNTAGVYGTLTVPSATAYPGARGGAASWKCNGTLYLFGGYNIEYDEMAAYLVYYNDLWSFDLSTSEWTWWSGSSYTNAEVSGEPECRLTRSSHAYIMGGSGNDGSDPRIFSDVWRWG